MWRGILGHDDVVERFRRALRAGRLASTYLLVGPEGVGKRRFALALAEALLCEQAATPHGSPLPEGEGGGLEPCGRCDSCRLFAAGNHPDLELISLPPDKATLPIALFVGDQEHRNREGLCHWISLRPFLGHRRVAIIDDADHFSQESANCLLKTLEEPPPHSLLILIGTSLGRQLPTIRSRAQVVHFHPLQPAKVQQILLDQQIVASAAEAARLAEASGGSVARASELADPELAEFHSRLIERIARPGWDVLAAEKAILDFVQAAGTEGALRRDRLRTIIGFLLDHYGRRLRPDAGQGASAAVLLALEASLTALEHVDRNANQSLVVSQWLQQLAAARTHAATVGA